MQIIDPNDSIEGLADTSPELAAILQNLKLTTATAGRRSLADVCRAHGLEPETTARVLTACTAVSSLRPAAAMELMSLPELCRHALRTSYPSLLAQLSRLDDLVAKLDAPRSATALCQRDVQNAYAAFRNKISAHLREEADILAIAMHPGADRDDDESRKEGSRLMAALPRLSHEHQKLDEDLDALLSQTAGCSDSGSTSDSVGALHRALSEFEESLQNQIFLENQTLFPRARAAAH